MNDQSNQPQQQGQQPGYPQQFRQQINSNFIDTQMNSWNIQNNPDDEYIKNLKELEQKQEQIKQDIRSAPTTIQYFKQNLLPLARVKKIMRSDEDVRMISAEAPVLFAKACEIFIIELTHRAWLHTQEAKRRTLQKNDIASSIGNNDNFDFLIDIIPREDYNRSAQGRRRYAYNAMMPNLMMIGGAHHMYVSPQQIQRMPQHPQQQQRMSGPMGPGMQAPLQQFHHQMNPQRSQYIQLGQPGISQQPVQGSLMQGSVQQQQQMRNPHQMQPGGGHIQQNPPPQMSLGVNIPPNAMTRQQQANMHLQQQFNQFQQPQMMGQNFQQQQNQMHQQHQHQQLQQMKQTGGLQQQQFGQGNGLTMQQQHHFPGDPTTMNQNMNMHHHHHQMPPIESPKLEQIQQIQKKNEQDQINQNDNFLNQ